MDRDFDFTPYLRDNGLGLFLSDLRIEFRGHYWRNTPIHSLRDVEEFTGINKSRLSRIEANSATIKFNELLMILAFHGKTLNDIQPIIDYTRVTALGS